MTVNFRIAFVLPILIFSMLFLSALSGSSDPQKDANVSRLIEASEATWAELERRTKEVNSTLGSLSYPGYPDTIDPPYYYGIRPFDGRLKVETDRRGVLNPVAELIGAIRLHDMKFEWGWAVDTRREWSKEAVNKLKLKAVELDLPALAIASFTLDRPAQAQGLASLATLVSEGQYVQTFEFSGVIYYVLLKFDLKKQ